MKKKGTGSRTIYYIGDAVETLYNFLLINYTRPVSIGNSEGISLQALAGRVMRAAGNGGHVR